MKLNIKDRTNYFNSLPDEEQKWLYKLWLYRYADQHIRKHDLRQFLHMLETESRETCRAFLYNLNLDYDSRDIFSCYRLFLLNSFPYDRNIVYNRLDELSNQLNLCVIEDVELLHSRKKSTKLSFTQQFFLKEQDLLGMSAFFDYMLESGDELLTELKWGIRLNLPVKRYTYSSRNNILIATVVLANPVIYKYLRDCYS